MDTYEARRLANRAAELRRRREYLLTVPVYLLGAALFAGLAKLVGFGLFFGPLVAIAVCCGFSAVRVTYARFEGTVRFL